MLSHKALLQSLEILYVEFFVIFSHLSYLGTDEHGLKIQTTAAAAGTSPEQFCDRISAQFLELFTQAGISYTDFIRTTELRHKRAVEHFWAALRDRGWLFQADYEGWYCTAEESFLAASQLTECTDAQGQRHIVSVETGHKVPRITAIGLPTVPLSASPLLLFSLRYLKQSLLCDGGCCLGMHCSPQHLGYLGRT